MVVLRAFSALLAGFATIAILVSVIGALLQRLTPSWAASPGKPVAGFAFVNLGYVFLSAAAGGYVTALVAAANPLVHTLALAMVTLALAALSAMQQRGEQPVWYALAQVAITPIGVLAGGLLRLRVLGIL